MPNIEETPRDKNIRHSYHDVVKVAEVWVNEASDEEREFLLTYLINTVLDDLCAEYIYQPLVQDTRPPYVPAFPNLVKDEKGEDVLTYTGEEIAVDLSADRIFTCPWNNDRTVKNLLNINKNEFQSDPDNQKAIYYTDINLCHISSGFHSTNAGRYLKEGSVKAGVRNLELLYPHCTTDGLDWYNIHTLESIQPVYDYRFAVVYTLARMRAGYKNVYVKYWLYQPN